MAANASESTMSSSSELPAHKAALLQACLDANSLSFGTFTLKSGRISPYFFNAGALHDGALLSTLSHAFAITIATYDSSAAPSPNTPNGTSSASEPTRTPAPARVGFDFDVLFGPSYKGIPLATTTAVALYNLASSPAAAAQQQARSYSKISYAFNRKVAKSYGDGGSIVGAPMAGKRVLIIDDVVTAGTAIGEAFRIIEAQGGTVVGVVVALDRQERAPPAPDASGVVPADDGGPGLTAIEGARRAYGVPVVAVLTLDDIIAGYRQIGTSEDIARLEEYRAKYRASG